tara:strand:+ start:1661 stop:2032 length:372 start_codon:yes stop_codon:yes gene_type:complete
MSNPKEKVEITSELLKSIRERLEQVFIAKTGTKLEVISMYEDGSFYCYKTWAVSYGGTEIEGKHIKAEDLSADLDDIIKVRKAEEEVKRQENEKRQKQNNDTRIRIEKEKRKAEYYKLKSEFE